MLPGLPAGPVVKTPCFCCRKRGFDPWSGILYYVQCCQKKKEKIFNLCGPYQELYQTIYR